MSAVFTTTPTKPSLYPAPSTTPMYAFEPYVSPSSAAHQRHLSASSAAGGAESTEPASRRRLRSAAPSISSNSHHRRVTGSLNVGHPAPPSGRAASFDLTPVGSPSKHTPPSLGVYRRVEAAAADGDDEDDEDSVMRDQSPLRFAQPRRLVATASAEREVALASGSANKGQYREPRAGLAVSSSNDQLRFGFDDGAVGGGNSSTEEGSRRGSLEDALAAFAPPAKALHQRQRQLSASNTIVLDSPVKKAPVGAQFSLSKPLGRPPPPPMVTTRTRSGSRAKRPAASMMMGGDDDDDACMGGDEDADGQGGHPMPDFGGRMRLSSGRADESNDDDDDDPAGGANATPGRSALRPLSFSGQLFSPAPAAAAAAAAASPRPDGGRHQRALTEHDLNKPVPSSGLYKSGSHSSHASYGSASKLLADEDNIFLESAAEAARTRSTTTTGLFSSSTSLGRSRSLIGADGKAPAGRGAISGSAIQGSSAIANSKKAVSMDNLQVPGSGLGDSHGADASSTAPPSAYGTQGRSLARSRRTGILSQSVRAGNGHKRGSSQDFPAQPVARPVGTTKSNSAQNLSAHLAAGGGNNNNGLSQSTSLSQLTTSNSASHLTGKLKAEAASSVLNRSAPATYNRSPDDLDALAFNDAKPLLAAFTAKQSLGKKFKPRDSGVSVDDSPLIDSPMTGEGKMLPPAAPHRLPVPLFLPSRLSTTQLAPPANGDEMDLQELLTPAGEPSALSGWPGSVAGGPSLSASTPSTTAFNFLGPEAAEAMASAAALHHSVGSSASKAMPDTPVKTKSFGGGGGGHATHPHPLSLASIRAEGSSSGSSSPSAAAGPSTGLPPLGSTSHHHSLNVLARSHRPSDVKPPHLRPLAMGSPAAGPAGSASPAPARSLIPKRSMTFRPKPSSLQARFTATSPESQTGSSSPPSGAESPTFLRRVSQQGSLSAAAAGASPRTGALAGMPRPVVDGQQRMSSLLRRTSSGVSGGMSGSESESGVEMTPTRRGPDSVVRSTSAAEPTPPSTDADAGRLLAPGPLLMTKNSSSPIQSRNDQELSVADLVGPSTARHMLPESSSAALQPRHSMPNLPPKLPSSSRRLHHRPSHPLPQAVPDEDLFEKRFKVVDALGQGAFSQVWKVQERDAASDRVWAIKRTKGVFEGAKDRFVELDLRPSCIFLGIG